MRIQFLPASSASAIVFCSCAVAQPGIWFDATFTLDSSCLAEVAASEGTDSISGIGEGFDTGINNFAIAMLPDSAAAFAFSNAFSRFGPNAGMPEGDRIIIEGFSQARLVPSPGLTLGRASGESSVRAEFHLPFGGRFRVLEGSFFQSGSARARVWLQRGGTSVFSFGEPGDSPAGTHGAIPPGEYALVFESSAASAHHPTLVLEITASYTFDLRLLANQSCPGDFDLDALVDDADFGPFARAYSLLDCADAQMPAECPADLDFSGMVDDADFVLFATAYDALACPS